MTNLTIRTNGFIKYFFGILTILSLFAILEIIKELILKFNFITLISVIIFAYLPYYFIYYLISNKIQLKENKLIIKTIIPNGNFIPKKQIATINLEDIKKIYLETLFTYDLKDQTNLLTLESKETINNPNIQKYIQNLKNKNYRVYDSQSLALYLLIIKKDNNINLISTKPFSKKDFDKLLNELKLINININTLTFEKN